MTKQEALMSYIAGLERDQLILFAFYSFLAAVGDSPREPYLETPEVEKMFDEMQTYIDRNVYV